MSNFEDLLKTTDEQLKQAREVSQSKAKKQVEEKALVRTQLAAQWPRLFEKMKEMSAEQVVDGMKFFPNGSASILLGDASVIFKKKTVS
jgi:hypothetical protein